MPAPLPEPATVTLGVVLRDLRLRAGLSQRQLAARMHVPRTYCSKTELGACSPNMASLQRVAVALDMTLCELFRECERRSGGERERDGLLADPFIQAVAAFVPHLSGLQRSAILSEMSDMARRQQRRSAAPESRTFGATA